MNSLISFFKDNLNLVCGLGTVIVLLLADFIPPPNITLTVAEGQINLISLSKFIASGIILVLMIPFFLYQKKNHFKLWLILSVIFLGAAFILLFSYLRIADKLTVYNRYQKQRLVTGDHYRPIVVQSLDSLKRSGSPELTRQEILESSGAPEDVWPQEELSANTETLILYYLTTVVAFCLFLLFGLQSLWCVTGHRQEEIKTS